MEKVFTAPPLPNFPNPLQEMRDMHKVTMQGFHQVLAKMEQLIQLQQQEIELLRQALPKQ